MTVLKSSQAETDLESIWLNSAQHYGTDHAAHVLTRIEEVFSLLDQYPKIGQTNPKLREGVRYFPMRVLPFIIFFTSVPTGIRIVRILHDRMRAEDHL